MLSSVNMIIVRIQMLHVAYKRRSIQCNCNCTNRKAQHFFSSNPCPAFYITAGFLMEVGEPRSPGLKATQIAYGL